MRICSLLPSATEIVFAVGAGESLVGITHECDYPSSAASLPALTRSKFPATLSSEEIDRVVSEAVKSGDSLYELDFSLLETLKPDLILTQKLCDVCAVSFEQVCDAAAGMRFSPEVVNLEPTSLEGILETIRIVGEAAGVPDGACVLLSDMRRRIEAVASRTSALSNRPRTFCMEWVSPPFGGGHWMGDLVNLAGGRDDLGNLHRPSSRIEWSRVLDFAPEVMVLTCCGFNLEGCFREGQQLFAMDGFAKIPAARFDRVFATDGSSYFSRPGPRIVDGLELLAHLIHPDIFHAPLLPQSFSVLRPADPAVTDG